LEQAGSNQLSKIVEEVTAANRSYARNFGDKGNLPRGFAILTCMDARLDPTAYAGLAEGDAHVIRNAGGRATDDAIRSLVISYKLLGTIPSARQSHICLDGDCIGSRRQSGWQGTGEQELSIKPTR
jgi:hypothetical protein